MPLARAGRDILGILACAPPWGASGCAVPCGKLAPCCREAAGADDPARGSDEVSDGVSDDLSGGVSMGPGPVVRGWGEGAGPGGEWEACAARGGGELEALGPRRAGEGTGGAPGLCQTGMAAGGDHPGASAAATAGSGMGAGGEGWKVPAPAPAPVPVPPPLLPAVPPLWAWRWRACDCRCSERAPRSMRRPSAGCSWALEGEGRPLGGGAGAAE